MNPFQGNEDTLEAAGRAVCSPNEKSTWKCFYPISTGTEAAVTQLQLLEKSVQAEMSSWLGPNGTRILLFLRKDRQGRTSCSMYSPSTSALLKLSRGLMSSSRS